MYKNRRRPFLGPIVMPSGSEDTIKALGGKEVPWKELLLNEKVIPTPFVRPPMSKLFFLDFDYVKGEIIDHSKKWSLSNKFKYWFECKTYKGRVLLNNWWHRMKWRIKGNGR